MSIQEEVEAFKKEWFSDKTDFEFQTSGSTGLPKKIVFDRNQILESVKVSKITFDLDSLDASVAPAVSNIEPGFTGFTIDEAKALIQSVKNKNVIGGDVVCLMPTKDQKNNITSMVAASIMFEIISVIAYN